MTSVGCSCWKDIEKRYLNCESSDTPFLFNENNKDGDVVTIRNCTDTGSCNATNRCDDIQFGGGICAMLFREYNCQSCLYEGIPLSAGVWFNTANSMKIRSLAVNKDCVLTRMTYGYLDYGRDFANIEYFNTSVPILKELDYFLQTESYRSEFSLTKNIIDTIKSWKVITAIVVPIIFVGAIITVTVLWLHQTKITLTEEEMEKLTQFIANPSDIDDENESIRDDEILQIFNFRCPFDETLNISRKDIKFEKKNMIGKGNFGIVYHGEYLCKRNWMKVGIKTLGEGASLEDYKSLINEIRIFSHLKSHPNIVKYIGVHFNLKRKNLEILCLMELCSSSLQRYLRELKKSLHTITEIRKTSSKGYTSLHQMGGTSNSNEIQLELRNSYKTLAEEDFRKLLKWSKEIASGMEYLNKNKVLHIDLATRNVLLEGLNQTAKISDFGLSKKLYQKTYYAKSNNETFWLPIKWIAPETLTERKFSESSDMWSYGITLYEIFNIGSEPYPHIKDDAQLFAFLNSGNRLERPDYAPPQLYENTMKLCWDSNPKLRPSFSQMKSFFESYSISPMS